MKNYWMEVFAIKSKELNDVLCGIANGIAEAFGSDCETLVVDMASSGKVIFAKNNGITGADVGDPAPDITAGAFLNGPHNITSLTRTANGRILKTAVFPVDDVAAGLCCAIVINFDCTGLLLGQAAASNLTGQSAMPKMELVQSRGNDIFGKMLNDVLKQTGTPPDKMNKAERMNVVRTLRSMGGLHMQKSIHNVADALGVSRCTVYNYLKEMQAEAN